MLHILVVTLLGSATFCQTYDIKHELDPLWEEFKITFSKNYYALDELYRRKIWEDNVDNINRHNLEADLGLYSYRLGINHFSDLTNEEFIELYASGERNTTFPVSEDDVDVYEVPSDLSLPSSVDWRTEGYVTPVKDQGSCGSCWAFSVTGAVEGQIFKSTGKLVSLSEQNLVDCDKNSNGCNGGYRELAFDYIRLNGINSEADYPYKASDLSCKFNSNRIAARISGYKKLPRNDEKALQAAVATVGPISVGVHVKSNAFYQYKSGIYDDTNCRSDTTNHAVLLVGYGSENGKDYWLVKNSWGTSWGDKGYIKMRRNYNNLCAIASRTSYPLV